MGISHRLMFFLPLTETDKDAHGESEMPKQQVVKQEAVSPDTQALAGIKSP